jgi:hypothetical protein
MLSSMCSHQHAPTDNVDNKNAIHGSVMKQVMSGTAKHVTVQCKCVAENVTTAEQLHKFSFGTSF